MSTGVFGLRPRAMLSTGRQWLSTLRSQLTFLGNPNTLAPGVPSKCSMIAARNPESRALADNM